MPENKKSIGKAISAIVIVTFAAKIMGFLRELLLSYHFGATGVSDAYLISQTIPGTLFTMIGTGLTTCFIPIYYAVKNRKEDADHYTNRILTIVFCISSVLIALVWAFTPFVVKLFASGFEGETLYYAVWFTRIGILSLYFSSMIYVYNSYLQANNLFLAQAFAAIPNSILIMVSIILGKRINLWLLSIGSTAAVGVQLLFILPALRKTSYRFGLRFDWRDASVKQFFKMMIPVIIGVSVNELNTLIDRTVASQVAIGGISALTYANSVIQFVQGGLVQPITTVFYPRITKAVSENDHESAERIMRQAVSLLLGLLIPITVGFMILGREITEVLFGRGAFDETAVRLTQVSVFFYSIGISFAGLRELLSRFFYANSNSRTPMLNTTIGVIVNVTLNLVLSRVMGLGGLALATSCASIVTTVLLFKDSRKMTRDKKITIEFTEILKILAASGIMGGLCWASGLVLQHEGPLLRLLIPGVAGILVYGLAGLILRLKIVDFLRSMICRKGKTDHGSETENTSD